MPSSSSSSDSFDSSGSGGDGGSRPGLAADDMVDGLVEELEEWNARQQASMVEAAAAASAAASAAPASVYDDDSRPRPKTRQDIIRR